MCKQSSAKILRNVIRITKFLERKRNPHLSNLSTTVPPEPRLNLSCSIQTCELPQLDHSLTTQVPSETNPPFFTTDSGLVSNQLQPVQVQHQPVQDQPQPVQVESTTFLSSTPSMPSPCLLDEPSYDLPEIDQAQDLQEPATSPDILTKRKFLEIMENFQWDLFNLPWKQAQERLYGPLAKIALKLWLLQEYCIPCH